MLLDNVQNQVNIKLNENRHAECVYNQVLFVSIPFTLFGQVPQWLDFF